MLAAPEEAGEHVGYTDTDRHVARLAVEAAMARLPEDQRLAVSLVLVEGLPYKEAAAVLKLAAARYREAGEAERLARALAEREDILQAAMRSIS